MNDMIDAAIANALLKPRSIALVGISDDAAKTNGRPLRFLRAAGYQGTIYNVNPTRTEVQGEPAYPSLSALPEVPEHAFILTNSQLAIEAVQECGRLGIRVATILAGGFSESGPEGAAREQQLRDIAKRTGVRILGPSSLGVVNLREKLVLTANAAFAEPELPVGGIFCASHSGSMLGALTSRGRAKGVGFSGLISVGSETDLCIGEICESTLDDPNITGYMLFLESLSHADALRRFAIGAAQRGKPVVAYKLGRSEAAAELAVSHTGALAGEDAVAETFFRDCGIARVETLEGFLEALPLLGRLPVSKLNTTGRTPTVGVVTTTGGGAAMAVDQLGIRGVAVVPPSAETLARMAERGINVNPGGIVDLTLAGTRYDVMKAALEVMLTAPEFDLVVATVGSSARYNPDLAVKPVIDSATFSETPLACFVVPEAPQALSLLNEAGVPSFRTPEACGDVIAAAFARRAPGEQVQVTAPTQGERMLNEADAYAMITPLGVPHAAYKVLNVNEPVPELGFDYPVVVKVLHDEIAHKTDVGGVILPVRDAAELAEAMGRIVDNVGQHLPQLTVERVLVQAMGKGLGEVLVGFRRDNDVGPLIMLAAGGILTEIYRDRAMRLAPVSVETAREMVSEVKALQALAGYRGRAEGDLEAIAQAVSNFSRLALQEDCLVLEAEMNPLLVKAKGEGVVAVDALVRIA
ncbi:CoA-binding domain-containing protein [Pseudomonas saudimassiliensis]|uniref:CoA-binding domain-containing protein n=1 Tax=Pseudomonas saudimassiliensis TaxID=1461581 RepID=A0A078MAQ7_9PSED|nr:acetate--CoA ligase family protein [Pseudomonas saudimassiliensis]CEA04503.1 CoA-binding domain-containing protein [Pseudomonas saudimassiliensis]CEF26656.1 CoA-binding domain-containing protein [Pseudomonas saudimassiliensis]